jgi:hypothetical protein
VKQRRSGVWRRSRRLLSASGGSSATGGGGEPRGRRAVYIPSLYYLGLGRLGFRLPKALVAPGYCCLVFVSGFGMLGGGLEVSFCLLHSESECGAGLVVVFGYHYVRLDSCPLLVLGVHILLLPFGGMKPWVANGASDGGVFFWDATSLGRQQLFPVVGWLLTGGGGCLFPSNPLQDGGQYTFIVFGEF